MKKVFYINCFVDPWVKVAEKLKLQFGFEPVYWVGYEDDDSCKVVLESFSDVLYHKYYDAWKCKFPQMVEEKSFQYSIDVDFLRQYASEELQAIKMMDRMDYDRMSFSFMERQRHFRNLVRKWMAAIDLLYPDLVVAPVMPHRVFDYVLYQLCKWKNIPYIVFDHTPLSYRFIVMDNLISINSMFVDKYQMMLKVDDPERFVSEDIKESMKKLRGDYNSAIPSYMIQHAINNKKSYGFVNLVKKIVRRMLRNSKEFWGEDGVLRRGCNFYYKVDNRKVEDSNYPFFKYSIKKLKSQHYKKNLREYYEAVAEEPVKDEKYVIYFMHYQPEATTCPGTNIFVDQRLCIDVLLANLPENYMVYVKEHPSQFNVNDEGQTSRMTDFYDDLVKLPRVRLISTKVDSFSLIENSCAVSTGTGTVGWEAIVRRKPVIIFGFTWYENYDGVLRIIDSNSATRIYKFIQEYEYDEHALMAYLAAFDAETNKAYYYRAGGKDMLHISEEECVNNIIDSLMRKINAISK